jgi:hypothetical protein
LALPGGVVAVDGEGDVDDDVDGDGVGVGAAGGSHEVRAKQERNQSGVHRMGGS